jgi:predicted DNA binding CopG/RHH family protein
MNRKEQIKEIIKTAQVRSLVEQANEIVNADSSDLGEGDKFQKALLEILLKEQF